MKDKKFLLYSAHLLPIAFLFFCGETVFRCLGFFWPALFRYELLFRNFTFYFFTSGMLFFLADALAPLFKKEKPKSLMFSEIKNCGVAVGMTAYNDELSIRKAAEDFLKRETVSKVIVVDNNSKDKTAQEAQKAGAEVVKEPVQGYGACCLRALKEAMKYSEIICLVEGDCTFSGSDLKKFTAYLENADMVVGTRTTKELNTPDSQMSIPLQWGNVFMAKLLQIRFWSVRLTDMGCTYRLIRREALLKIIDKLQVKGNHFLCEMTLTALEHDLTVIEIPVTFKKRVGESKGVGGNFFKAAKTAIAMWRLIVFN